MNKWAVDVTGINLEADLRQEECKNVFTGHSNKSSARVRTDGRQNQAGEEDELGEVNVLTEQDLYRIFEARQQKARLIEQEPDGESLSPLSATARSQSQRSGLRDQSINLDDSLSRSLEFCPKHKEIKVYENFLVPDGKPTATTITIKQTNYCNVDIVSAFLKHVFKENSELSEKFSDNPRHYKLFIADEFTGDAEMAVMLDKVAQDFTCYALQPLPLAKLYLFPQRTTLLPTTAHDINLIVSIRSSTDKNVKPIQRLCCVPTDMLVESLENLLISRLPNNCIVQGSLRVRYGPLEININEMYNFGAGCGGIQCPVSEHTMLSLHRFGVKEVAVSGRVVEEADSVINDNGNEIEIELSTEDALAFQQFEVIAINRYGARQQRMFCVDGDHIYTIKPNSEITEVNTTEKSIKDVEAINTLQEKPKYLEIIYTKASKFEPDRIECTTTYNKALLEEKLRVIQREYRKKQAEEAEQRGKRPKAFGRFFNGLSRFFGS